MMMKTYLVGGSVRDKLLGITPNDTDYLVTDSSEDELLARGLVKVGLSFPIFLDRVTGDEYTLANSVEEDLARRDLTINAMAIDESGNLIDPFHGTVDLKNKLLKHVSEKNFFTDPLRVYRTARFQCQLQGFTIHPETESLMKKAVKTEEFAKLPGERIIKELKRVLLLDKPARFFDVLSHADALSPHLKELVNIPEKFPATVDESVRFAWLCSNLSVTELESLCLRLGIQNDWKDIAIAWIKFRNLEAGPEKLLDFFYDIDAFRKPESLEKLAILGPSGIKNVKEAFQLLSPIGISSIDPNLTGKDISRAIREERLRRIKANS